MPERELPEEIRNQAEKSETQELSPEVLEMVMSKVKDINEIDTAYLSLTRMPAFPQAWRETMSKVFENGLLGINQAQRTTAAKGEILNITKETWAADARKEKDARVYFNIIGRSAEDLDGLFIRMHHELGKRSNIKKSELDSKKIDKTTYFKEAKDVTGLIFSLDSFKEKLVPEGRRDFPEDRLELNKDTQIAAKGKHKEYRGNQFAEVIKGKAFPYTDMGFYLSFRVAPRFFEGVIFKRMKDDIEETDSAKLREYANEIAKLMVQEYKNNLELLIPVYDVHGNLWWPKPMNYKEVKNFIADREKAKDMDSETNSE